MASWQRSRSSILIFVVVGKNVLHSHYSTKCYCDVRPTNRYLLSTCFMHLKSHWSDLTKLNSSCYCSSVLQSQILTVIIPSSHESETLVAGCLFTVSFTPYTHSLVAFRLLRVPVFLRVQQLRRIVIQYHHPARGVSH